MLPYDATPPPEERREEPAGLDRPLGDYEEPSALDRPLDDYQPEVVPEHVQSLMGRMSKGKVYLLEESPAVVIMDDGERIRRDPRLAQLAEQLDSQDPTAWLEAVSEGSASPILHQVLYVRSELIKHLSTSKVFSWATGLGAGVMGIEWLNDTTLELLFTTSAAALLGLSLLSKAGFDPGEGDDPLLERSAHSVPLSLLPGVSKEGVELLGSSSAAEGGVRRKGRGGFGGSMSADNTASSSSPAATPVGLEEEVKDGIDPNARIAIRYATEADKELRQQAKQSDWYKRNGRTAGKETASQTRSFPSRGGNDGYSFSGREETGGGREFARRIGRERRGPYDREQRSGRNQNDLDKELDGMVQRRLGQDQVGGDDVDMDRGGDEFGRERRRTGGGRGRGGRGGRREHRNVEDLDKELDDLFSARTEAL